MRTVYYNEYNAHAALWIRLLIRRGLIPNGLVDEWSIKDISPKDLRGFTQCHFFAGIGGWPYALRLAGWPASEPVWTGSCPCQPFSALGKHRGFEDENDLWPAWFGLIKECRPPAIFGEQVTDALKFGWLDRVADDLESVGYAVAAAVFPAGSVGAPQLRQRLYFVGYADCPSRTQLGTRAYDAVGLTNFWSGAKWLRCPDGQKRPFKPGVRPVVDGLPGRMGALRGAGNAIVPQQAAEFILASSWAKADVDRRILRNG